MNLIKAAIATEAIIGKNFYHDDRDIKTVSYHQAGVPYLNWMLEEIESGRKAGEKGNRWLGYVQGVAVARGIATVDEFRAANSKAK